MDRLHGRDRGESSLGVTLVALGIGVAALFGIGHATEATYGADQAKTYLEQTGYSTPELEDTMHVLVGLRGCDRSDTLGFRFQAIPPNGSSPTEVVVCKGLFKGATIRQG